MSDALYALLFFLPAGLANASPVLANRIPLLNRWSTPVDFGKTFRGKRILGNNKSWRGVLFGAVIGSLTAVIVHNYQPYLLNGSLLMESMPWFGPSLLGFVMGFGALLGDSVESFFKRRLGIKPGNSWFPFDQTDYIIGGLLLILPLVELSWSLVGLILVIYFCLHLIVSYIGYLLGLKDKPL